MSKVNVNEATADELNAVGTLRGHGFGIVRYHEESRASRAFDDLRRCQGWRTGSTRRRARR